MQSDSFIIALKERAKNRTLRELAADLGLPESSIGVLSKALNGKPIAAATERRLRRALGLCSGDHSYKSLAVPA